ncbi:M14 family metallopeptidase [Arsukibacterium sp. UBA3155]|mgnify:FL=1|uniref:M14 family metallopeptidase n=1 Tax=Arsukibacterium sp. UBA3155 TaxID=1946058 RepID=UPI0025C4833E|nr:M14 family metallopeptidase [Arsukibacterium sp. UBA3155]|tara:strand:+ start:20589 stop:23261 length:2673 start_codon:yes stop_codon:yes gene_type:complete
MSLQKIAVLTAALALGSAASQAVPVFPDSDYRDTVASVEQVLGFPLASRIAEPAQIKQYFEQLAQAHPNRIKLVPYAKSWQGRPLFYVVIGSEKNIGRLADIQLKMQQLANPQNVGEREAQQLISELPASVWIASSLHGNEISPPESAMALAYHLLADNSQQTASLLSNTLVYIDPLQNPDGRNRFVSRYYATVGLEHSADRLSAEQNEPWPQGRTNHYLFDMNRDWISLTQPETRGRVKALQQVYPLVFVDSHEMGGDMGYYFSPEAEPYNPHIQANQRQSLQWLGENNARWFDKFGYDYFTREIFDAFYPGYGASWPLYQGSVAMTYEMASARGHQYRKDDGEILTFADGVQRNFVAFMATIETASQRAPQLLTNFYQYRKDAIKQGSSGPVRSFIFPAKRDEAGHTKLSAILTEHGITVGKATESFKACGESYQAGSYVVNTAQPTYHLIRTLLDDTVPMDKAFIAKQEQRRANNLPDEIYDVTAWSLPLMYNLPVVSCNRAVNVATTTVSAERILAGKVTNPAASFGYIVPWGDMAAARFASGALQQGVTVKSSDLPFTHQNGKRYPAGSLIVSNADNSPQLSEQVEQLAAASGATVTGIDTSWVTDGPNFGSYNVKTLHKPNVAMLWDEPTNPLSAGSARFVLERNLNYPVTAMRPEQLRGGNLSHYQVLIVPASSRGSYQQILGDSGLANLRSFVERGGVLIALGNATDLLLAGESPLLSSKREYKVREGEERKTEQESKVAGSIIKTPEEYQQWLVPEKADPDWVPGFIARAEVDQQHWLTAGVPETVNSVYVGNQVYQPLTIADGRNVVRFAPAEQLLAGGFVWDENRLQIANKPLVMVQAVGKGQVISFTQEPNFRAYVDGMHLLYINAVFRGAAHASPLR